MVLRLTHTHQASWAKLRCVSYGVTQRMRRSLPFSTGEDVKGKFSEGLGLQNPDAIEEAVRRPPCFITFLLYHWHEILGNC